jgi:hypothetical protein
VQAAQPAAQCQHRQAGEQPARLHLVHAPGAEQRAGSAPAPTQSVSRRSRAARRGSHHSAATPGKAKASAEAEIACATGIGSNCTSAGTTSTPPMPVAPISPAGQQHRDAHGDCMLRLLRLDVGARHHALHQLAFALAGSRRTSRRLITVGRFRDVASLRTISGPSALLHGADQRGHHGRRQVGRAEQAEPGFHVQVAQLGGLGQRRHVGQAGPAGFGGDAVARTLPSRMKGCASVSGSTARSIWPPATSVSTCGPDLYGTCTISSRRAA